MRPLPRSRSSIELNLDGLDAAICRCEGEDRVAVDNDCVDLTPYLREDILLEFPQHPLCKPECRGLKKTSTGKAKPGRQPASRDGFVAVGRIEQTETVIY